MFWRLQTLLLATTALVPLAAASVDANPLGAQVVAGSASVQGQGTPKVTITQQRLTARSLTGTPSTSGPVKRRKSSSRVRIRWSSIV